jgi:hypothetical protein
MSEKQKLKNNYKILQPYHIKLDNAKRVVSKKGKILKKEVLSALNLDQVVRISMHISKKSPYDCRLLQDAPYVQIMEFNKQNILGKILNEMRTLPDNYYPLKSNEFIWFTKNNIIEILDLTEEDEKKYGTNEFVPYTGPLETIDSDGESSECNSDSSESESDEDRNIDLSKKNINAPLLRGRQYEY